MNEKIFSNRLNELYQPPVGKLTVVDVPEMKFMMFNGAGNPENDGFKAAVKWLFSIAYYIKPHIKKQLRKRFVEPPLECLFWSDQANFPTASKDKWKWRAMIVVLDMVTEDLFSEAVARVEAKLGPRPASLSMGHYNEGKSVQTKHVGDYSGVEAVCQHLYREFLPRNKLKPSGYYHEIYLNDPSRVAPDKRQIIIRQPVT